MNFNNIAKKIYFLLVKKRPINVVLIEGGQNGNIYKYKEKREKYGKK